MEAVSPKQLARELCRDSGCLVDLLGLLELGGNRLEPLYWGVQRPGDSISLPLALAHRILTIMVKSDAKIAHCSRMY